MLSCSNSLCQASTRGCTTTLKVSIYLSRLLAELLYDSLCGLEVEYLKRLHTRSTRESDVGWTIMIRVRAQPQISKDYFSPWPFSNIRPRSTLTLSSVCPCDLCILKAHARISGICDWPGEMVYRRANEPHLFTSSLRSTLRVVHSKLDGHN